MSRPGHGQTATWPDRCAAIPQSTRGDCALLVFSRMFRPSLAVSLLLIGCNLGSGNSTGAEEATSTGCVKPHPRSPNNGPLPECCDKIEGGQIGMAPQTLTTCTATLTITSWIPKEDEGGDYIGFTYTLTNSATITVKASTDIFFED